MCRPLPTARRAPCVRPAQTSHPKSLHIGGAGATELTITDNHRHLPLPPDHPRLSERVSSLTHPLLIAGHQAKKTGFRKFPGVAVFSEIYQGKLPLSFALGPSIDHPSRDDGLMRDGVYLPARVELWTNTNLKSPAPSLASPARSQAKGTSSPPRRRTMTSRARSRSSTMPRTRTGATSTKSTR